MPWGPTGRSEALKSDFVSDPFLTFELDTAFFLICLEPTLFFGSLTAAYPVPPSAMNTATQDMTFANVSRERSFLDITPSQGGVGARGSTYAAALPRR